MRTREEGSLGDSLSESGLLALLGLVPEGFQLGARDLSESGALLAGDALHFTETVREFRAGFLQGYFWIEIEKAGEVDGDEEDIAQFTFDALGQEGGRKGHPSKVGTDIARGRTLYSGLAGLKTGC